MALRPGRVVKRIKRPYTRVSRKVPRKSYVVGVPFPKTHQFEMGNRAGDFDLTLYLVTDKAGNVRDNALEAGRIVSNKFLDSTIGNTNYFMKILVYPHHVIREKPIATGAGADRYSQGMRQAFGKPSGTAAVIRKKQRIVLLKINKENLETGKIALKRFALKLSVPTRIIQE